MTVKENPFLTAAMRKAQKGVRVFPCVPSNKNPITGHGFKDATTDEKIIREWWTKYPDANVAIPTGELSGLFVLDVDMGNGKDGEGMLAKLIAEHGSLPTTLEVRTPRGGLHLYFKHPGQRIPTRTNHPAPALDVRGDGGYVLVPPSRTQEGEYRYTNATAPAECPGWLLAMLVGGNRETEKALAVTPVALSQAENATEKESRIRDALQFIRASDYATWIKVGMALHSRDDIGGLAIWDEWSRTCPAKYHEGELPKKWASFKNDRPDGVTLGTLFDLAKRGGWKELVSVTPNDWPEPQSLPNDLPPVPAFEFACLPDTLRPWIADIAERMQCPPDFPAVGAVIALGSLVGRKIGIRPKRRDDWLVVPNLWGFVVGRPGVMKTPALEQPLMPLRRLAAGAFEKHEADMRQHDVNEMLESQRAKLGEKKVAGFLSKGNEEAARAEAESVLHKEANEPVCRRYETNDPTIEKLGALLAENPTGLLLFRDELFGFLRGLDREGHEGDRATYLEMWTGTGDFTSDRIQRGTVKTPSILSILGGIQPDLLTAYIREAVRGGIGADGLLQRFQLGVWPDVSNVWRNVDRWPDTQAKNEAFEVFKYLDGLTAEAVHADTSSGIPFLRFADDAQDRFDLWRADLEKALRSDTEHPAFEAHLSKYRKLVPALALLIHLANRDTGPVSLSALGKALLWRQYLEAHARRIYSAVLRPDTAAARELAKHLRRGELPDRFTLRETYRKGWAGLGSKDDAEAATEILCDLGWIRQVPETGRTNGRPGSPAFETNPQIRGTPPVEPPQLTKPTSGSSVSLATEVFQMHDKKNLTVTTIKSLLEFND